MHSIFAASRDTISSIHHGPGGHKSTPPIIPQCAALELSHRNPPFLDWPGVFF